MSVADRFFRTGRSSGTPGVQQDSQVHTSFLRHAGGLYFWSALALSAVCCIAYLWHDPIPAPNGGTWLGYSLGTLGALMILWLLYLGRRKRDFINGSGTVRGWVSAHVYFGTSLLVIATLHSGFQVGWNIHTLAYVLMCMVIFSGLFGVWAYRTYPHVRNDMKRSQSLDEFFFKLEEIDQQLKHSVKNMSEDIRVVVTSAIDRTHIGGSVFDQISGRDRSRLMLEGKALPNPNQDVLLAWLVARLSIASGEESGQLSSLVRDYGARRKLVAVIRSDIKMLGRQEIWLFFHVPLSFGLIAALIAHIVSVFFYW